MVEILTSYIERNTFLHRLNPLSKLTYCVCLIILAFIFPHSFYPFSLFLSTLPLVFLARIGRAYLSMFLKIILPFLILLFTIQSLFYPGGKTVLFRLDFLSIKEEGLLFATGIAARILVMVSAFLLLILTTHPAKLVVSLVNKGLPFKGGYLVLATLLIIPQMQRTATAIMDAQRSRGLETEGGLLHRFRSYLPLLGPLVMGSLVSIEERAMALEVRGFSAPVKKSFLVEIEDSRGERIFRMALILLTLVAIGWRIIEWL